MYGKQNSDEIVLGSEGEIDTTLLKRNTKSRNCKIVFDQATIHCHSLNARYKKIYGKPNSDEIVLGYEGEIDTTSFKRNTKNSNYEIVFDQATIHCHSSNARYKKIYGKPNSDEIVLGLPG
jgi:hypothetical protein